MNAINQSQCPSCGYWQVPLNYCPSCGYNFGFSGNAYKMDSCPIGYKVETWVSCQFCGGFHKSNEPCPNTSSAG